MQAVIALCHFCESHGPRVVITCQPLRSLPQPVTSAVPCGYERSSFFQDPTRAHGSDRPSTSRAGQPEVLPRYYGDCSRTTVDTEERCNACSSLGPQKCLLTNDHENKTSYITSQVSLKEQVFERVKTACIRSLSCEIPVANTEDVPSSSTTQPVRISSYDTDIKNVDLATVRKGDGHLMFGDTENGYVISYFFRIHDSKARGFLRSFSILVLTQDSSSLTTNYDFFIDAVAKMKDRIQVQAESIFHYEMEHQDTGTMRPEHASVAGRLPHGFLSKKRVVIDPTRSLQVLTGLNNIWDDLHRSMMYTLRAQTLRFEDRMLEGKPTQDMLYMMEMDHSDIVELNLDQPNHAEQLKNLKHIALQFAERDERDLEMLLAHVISGGQIIVQCAQRALAKQFILALTNLLPIGCLKVQTYTEKHYPPTQYNFLGCSQPLHVPDSADALYVRVVTKNEEETSLLNCSFEIIHRPEHRIAAPRLIARYKQLLMDSEVRNNLLRATLQGTREDWMSRAKLLYQLEEQRAKDPSMPSGDLIGLVKQGTSADRSVLTFWQNGMSRAYKAFVEETIEEHRASKRVHQ